MRYSLNDNLIFSKISKDKNKIHISHKFAENFFVKKPICHGANVAIKMLKLFQIKYKNKYFRKLNINFYKPIYINEQLKIKINQKRIILSSQKEIKIIIYLIKVEKKNINNYLEICEILKKCSRVVGNKSKLPSLIAQIKINDVKKKEKIKKIKDKLYIANVNNLNLSAEILFSKLERKEKIIKYSFNKHLLKGSSFIFGGNSDLGVYTQKMLNFNNYKYTIYKGEYLNKKNFKVEIKKYFKKLNEVKFIFYFLTPKIIMNGKSNYKFLYLEVFFEILKQVRNKKILFFYPSTNLINKPDKNFKEYIYFKNLAEIQIRKINNKKKIRVYRLPKFKSSQTYNIFTGYEGISINRFREYLTTFLKKDD